MNPAQFQRFAEAYAPAVLQAVVAGHAFVPGGQTPELYALETALAMLERLSQFGLPSIERYGLNRKGGALSNTCKTLGIENTPASIERFLAG